MFADIVKMTPAPAQTRDKAQGLEALAIVGEEIAQHRAARGLVGVDAYEARHGRARRHSLLGKHALHLPRRRAVALACHARPDRALAVVIGGDRERLSIPTTFPSSLKNGSRYCRLHADSECRNLSARPAASAACIGPERNRCAKLRAQLA